MAISLDYPVTSDNFSLSKINENNLKVENAVNANELEISTVNNNLTSQLAEKATQVSLNDETNNRTSRDETLLSMINSIVLEGTSGDSSAEVALTRVNKLGFTFATTNDRASAQEEVIGNLDRYNQSSTEYLLANTYFIANNKMDSVNYTSLSFIPVKKGDVVYYTGSQGTNTSVSCIVGWNIADYAIGYKSVLLPCTTGTKAALKVIIPENVNYITASFRTTESVPYELAVYHNIGYKITETEKRYEIKDLELIKVVRNKYYINGVLESDTNNIYAVEYFDVSSIDEVYLDATDLPAHTDAYVLFDVNGNLLSHIGSGAGTQNKVIDTTNASKLAVTVSLQKVNYPIIQAKKFIATDKLPYWNGKKIVWFGTSIPAGGYSGLITTYNYPKMVGKMLNANVYNEAIGSSSLHCRRLSRVTATNPYGFNTNFESVSRALASNLAEKQWIINWLKAHLNGGVYVVGYENACTFDDTIFTSNVPTSCDETLENNIKDCSYENKLIRHLGDYNRADLYVLDHGYNDYTLEDNDFSESDPYNLNYFRGAMNFIISLILSDNPFAKIVILTHNNSQKIESYNTGVIGYQEKVADDWQLQCCQLYKLLGWSSKYQITTKWTWNTTYRIPYVGDTDQSKTIFSLFNYDGVHPHSDFSNKALDYIAKTISAWIEANVRKVFG